MTHVQWSMLKVQFCFHDVVQESPHRDSTSFGVHPRGNVHTCQFLKEQLGGVRNMDLCDFRLVLARATLELSSCEISIVIVS